MEVGETGVPEQENICLHLLLGGMVQTQLQKQLAFCSTTNGQVFCNLSICLNIESPFCKVHCLNI